jgi:hypothetical protein
MISALADCGMATAPVANASKETNLAGSLFLATGVFMM